MDTFDPPVLSPADVRAVEARAMLQCGVNGITLMERAGRSLFQRFSTVWPWARSAVVVAGRGNNGGDGYVLARLLQERGVRVQVWAPYGRPDRGDAMTACANFLASGGHIGEQAPTSGLAGGVIVDALFGIGLSRDLGAESQVPIDWINQTGCPVLAVDTPSGLDTQTGRPSPVAVYATETVTFVAPKVGFYLAGAPNHLGILTVSTLGLPAEAYGCASPCLQPVSREQVLSHLPRRLRTAHKGQHGRILVVGGAPGMPGAIRLAGEAALRAGAGLVSVATHPSHAALIAMARPELICWGVEDGADLKPHLAVADVVALGPGLGQSRWARELFDAAFESAVPLLLDADALNLLAADRRRRSAWILTPHPGEAARLLGWTAERVQADRIGALTALVARYEATVVLKGARTLIAGPENPTPFVCLSGNPGMATAGMGDVLTGVIAGLLGQRRQPCHLAEVAAVAAQLHGEAGDFAAYASAYAGERGLLASDLLANLRKVVNP